MKRFFTVLGTLFVFGLFALLAGGFWFMHEIKKPGEFTEQKEVLIPQGTSGYGVAQELGKARIISHPGIFYAMLRINPVSIKAGEYLIPPQSSLSDVLEIFREGKVIQRSVTLTEGQTVKQALILLNNTPNLEGTIAAIPEEGTLLPDTYNFIRGDTRQSLIDRMQKAHDEVMQKLWAARDADIGVTSPQQALVLASIVEKETGVAAERPRIAGLFYNRLNTGMPLQSDPTVVYVITDRLGHMEGKKLYAKSMQIDSPYNTYKVTGLPPAPIANPGRASIEAVLHPEKHDYVYFVADGTGGHVFGRTLEEHHDNVRNWYKIRDAAK